MERDPMPSHFHFLNEIDASNDNWCIRVCISRLWDVMDFNNQDELKSVDMILIDENGDQIHASVPNRHILKYKSMLYEGNFCIIRNFNVDYAKNNYRPVKHKYKIFFKWDTSVMLLDDISDDQFPHYSFSLTPFEDIGSHYGDKAYSIDIIGVLDFMSTIIEKKNEEGVVIQRRRDLIIRNERNEELKVTLWGKKANEIKDESFNITQKPPVLIITSASVNIFNGVYNLSSTNSTRVYVNLNVPEVTHMPISGNTITEQSKLVDILSMLSDDTVIGKKFVASAFVAEIVHDYEPFYFSCDACRRKAYTKDCRKWCRTCEKFVINPKPRYGVRMRMEDDTSSLTVMMFDKETESLLGRPVTDIIKLSEQEGGSEVVKDILNALIGLELIFEVKVNEYNLRNKGSTFTTTKIIPKTAETNSENILEEREKLAIGPKKGAFLQSTVEKTHQTKRHTEAKTSLGFHSSLGDHSNGDHSNEAQKRKRVRKKYYKE